MKPSPELLENAFVKEYEFSASARLLFPYISTPVGLAQWFAEKAETTSEGLLMFLWDGQEHLAVGTQQKINKMARYSFSSSPADLLVQERHARLPFIEFSLVPSDFSQGIFLKITDATEASGEQEELWDGLVGVLKDIFAGN